MMEITLKQHIILNEKLFFKINKKALDTVKFHLNLKTFDFLQIFNDQNQEMR